jgi:diacylglycerol kinase family enzyme/membrane-associated phospholipid phosphatase
MSRRRGGIPWRRPADRAPRPVDVALRRLSRSANKGRLWLALAAAGVAAKGRPRRAGLRGVGALAATSFLVNVVVKPLIRRQRPDITLTPLARRLTTQPWTTSFPSGHAASAAAFTTGVAMEHRLAGGALAPVAAAVGYSRVHVGVHHVSDVVVGAAIGSGVALATRRWWPVRPDRPARVREDRAAPALPAGDGLVVVANHGAGFGDAGVDRIRGLLPAAEIVEPAPGIDLTAVVRRHARRMRAVGVAGGDGSVAAAAAAAVDLGLPLAVFPTGTFNHFARDLGLEWYGETARAIRTGEAVAVDVAVANGVPFVNTASIGGYPQIVRRREQLAGRLGRWLAMAVATGAVLRQQQPIQVTLDGRPVDTWGLLVGNGRYTRRGAVPVWRERLDDGLLDVQYLPVERFARTRSVLAVLAGVADRHGAYRTRMAATLRVEVLCEPVTVARDGEPGESGTAFEFGKLPGRLVVYCPRVP